MLDVDVRGIKSLSEWWLTMETYIVRKHFSEERTYGTAFIFFISTYLIVIITLFMKHPNDIINFRIYTLSNTANEAATSHLTFIRQIFITRNKTVVYLA